MKQLSLRLDNFLIHLVQQEARSRKSTKMEIIRTALMNYFINRKDIQDIQLAESRLHEEDLSFEKYF